jgi:hypothetical protein
VPRNNNFAAQKIFPHCEIRKEGEKKPMREASVFFLRRARDAAPLHQ